MPSPATSKRPYRIDPEVARERARQGGLARSSPDVYITSLARATLTAALLMPFLAEEDEPAAGAGAR